jgi:CRP-like cAMP-binding protein
MSSGGAAFGDPAAERVALLEKIPIFAGMAQMHLERIAAIGAEEEHGLGTTLFAEGDPGTKLYVVLSGAVRVSRMLPGMGEEALAIFKSGAYFGEMALIDDAPRSAHAIVHERARLLALAKADLQDLLFVDRELAYELLWNFVRTLSRRLREANDKMTFLASSNKF